MRRDRCAVSRLLLLVLVLNLWTCSHVRAGELVCNVMEEGKCLEAAEVNLTRPDERRLYDTWEVPVPGRGPLHPKIIHVHPLTIEIPDFLSPDECDAVIALTNITGFTPSDPGIYQLVQDLRAATPAGDDILNAVFTMLSINFKLIFDDEQIEQIYKNMSVSSMGDLYGKEKLLRFYKVLEDYVKAHPEKKYWNSEGAAVDFGRPRAPVLEDIKRRLGEVTGLSELLLSARKREMQIVHYKVDGHYFGHVDSYYDCDPRGRNPCSFLTLLVYLNDVTKGGETAFPHANLTLIEMDELGDRKSYLAEKCTAASLTVKPKRGKALLWYNHLMSPQSTDMGDLDVVTLHGGCPVLEGEKWLATFRFEVDNFSSLLSQKKLSVSQLVAMMNEASDLEKQIKGKVLLPKDRNKERFQAIEKTLKSLPLKKWLRGQYKNYAKGGKKFKSSGKGTA